MVDLHQYGSQHVVILKLENLSSASFCNLSRISKNTLLSPCVWFLLRVDNEEQIYIQVVLPTRSTFPYKAQQCVVPLPCASVGFPLQRCLHLELAVACGRTKKDFFRALSDSVGPSSTFSCATTLTKRPSAWPDSYACDCMWRAWRFCSETLDFVATATLPFLTLPVVVLASRCFSWHASENHWRSTDYIDLIMITIDW